MRDHKSKIISVNHVTRRRIQWYTVSENATSSQRPTSVHNLFLGVLSLQRQFCQGHQTIENRGISGVASIRVTGPRSVDTDMVKVVQHKLHLPNAQDGQHVDLVSQQLCQVRTAVRGTRTVFTCDKCMYTIMKTGFSPEEDQNVLAKQQKTLRMFWSWLK